MSNFGRFMQLVGTLWPIFGFGLVALAALISRGPLRWWILFTGPLIVFAPVYFFADRLGTDGNMLFVLIFILSYIGLAIYYPLLIIVGLIVRFRNAGRRGESTS